MSKTNTSRRFPGETNRCRPDHAAARREEADARQKKSNALTPQERLVNLDIKFGKDSGAKKERAKLAKLLEKNTTTKASPNEQVPVVMQQLPDEIMQEINALNEETSSKKKIKAKDRRAQKSKNP